MNTVMEEIIKSINYAGFGEKINISNDFDHGNKLNNYSVYIIIIGLIYAIFYLQIKKWWTLWWIFFQA
ncbi:unnamed protein product [Blepharisma stoltei]|uniref:Uncharacterized protein n=1 Tax=Blepharisma stoltei TaxID=1481888 RepID=A0AAU9J910_9CILI|nr:unnamed protein product [Blepharisma stoltei]